MLQCYNSYLHIQECLRRGAGDVGMTRSPGTALCLELVAIGLRRTPAVSSSEWYPTLMSGTLSWFMFLSHHIIDTTPTDTIPTIHILLNS